MSIPLQYDGNGDPYLWNPGDLGIFITVSPTRNAATGERISERVLVPGTALFTGGLDANGAPTLAARHGPVTGEDIPIQYSWPRSLGPDPR